MSFHLPLPPDLLRALHAEAAESRKPATEVARDALREWLDHRHQARIDQRIREYATAMAGTGDDLPLEAVVPGEAWQ